MNDIQDDIPKNWRDDPLENTPPVRKKNFLRNRGYEDPSESRVMPPTGGNRWRRRPDL